MPPQSQQTSDDVPEIRDLDTTDIDRLRLGWWSRFDTGEVERTLQQAPGLSVWAPGANEYLIAGPWRHRTEIVHAVELVAIRHPVELVRAAVERARRTGKRVFLAIEATEHRRASYYDRCGLSLLEEVIAYERGRDRQSLPGLPDGVERISRLDDLTLSELAFVDHDAFPWLWRNGGEEFRDYFGQPGVELYLLRQGGSPGGYLGISLFPGWGHIDRVAVLRAAQGNGLGRMLTALGIARISQAGASTIGLSTQSRNLRSQTLYENLGFRRKSSGEYRIYGVALQPDDSIDELVAGSGA
jgi:ribosomal protein S18 acetylase RimI-like enzyme